MSEKVGGIYYDVSLDTSQMIEAQRKAKRELENTSKSLDGLDLKLTSVARAVGILGAAMAALKSAQMADEMRMLSAQVQVAAGSMEAGAAAMSALEAIAKRTQTSIAANASVFNRLNQSMLAMGGTQQDTLNLTELLAKAIKISGASAAEGASAMTQFGQALGSGTLAGDELKSLLETAPYLMGKLAEGLGVPTGALKKMGEEGKLTADVVTNALNKAATQIDEDFKKFPQTISSAMDVAQDAAGRLNSKMDELTGTSAAITGVVQGAGTVFDELAKQIAEAAGESDKLGRNDSIKGWAESTKVVLSYVVDAADGVIRVFKALGKWIGAELAAAGAVMTGNFEEARTIIGLVGDDIDEIMQKQLAGQKMREAWTSGAGKGSDAAPGPTGNKLTTPVAGTAGSKGGGKAKAGAGKGREFDAEAYLAGLQKSVVSAMEAVDIAEQEAIRKNDELYKAKEISFEEHEKARTLILQSAQQERDELEAKGKKAEFDRAAEQVIREEKAAKDAVARAQEELRLLKEKNDLVREITKAANPIEALRQEYEAKLQIVAEYERLMAAAGVDATAQAQITRTQITRQHELQRTALAEQSFRSQSDANEFLVSTLNSFSQSATSSITGLINGTMSATDVMRNLGNVVLNEAVSALVQIGFQQVKNALFAQTVAASEAAAAAARGGVYAASVSAQVMGMSAMAAQNAFAATAAIPIIGPGLAPAAATLAASTASALGAPAIATAPLAGARQYGGPVSADRLYRINEKGAPEMFTAGNGSQYMLPTTGGRVTAADKVGGEGLKWTIINNTGIPFGEPKEVSIGENERALIISQSEQFIASRLGDPNSTISRSMNRNYSNQRSR